ncbi:MAG: HEAT repeat domain-containing protein [Planctomycetota bacterium]
MRIAAVCALLLLFPSCSTTDATSEAPYQQPNSLMGGEITRRVEQIPYQHRDELLQNLLWLAQTGEQTIPALLQGLTHENAKVRSSSCWVLGRLRDRRTIPNLQAVMNDSDMTVRTEAARTLVTMGDLKWSPVLIECLDSDKKEVRYMCHEALKTASGHDFGYDHLSLDHNELKLSVLRWRQWWSEYSGDAAFAQGYQQKHNLQPAVAAPNGETKAPESGSATGNGSDGNTTQGQPNVDLNCQPPTPNPMPNPDGQGNPVNGQVPPMPGSNEATPVPAPMPMPVPVPTPNPGSSTTPSTTPPGTTTPPTTTSAARGNGGQ